ncbi:MAG: hypothetical protein IIB35_06945, partial [Gemmatimonadetes bacterium]|nr:hypothetical protein [Gemmatimonadota bacterium]
DTEGFWCDAVAFEAFVDEGRFEEALALYRGDLLEGFHLSGCLEFERWLETERRRLKQRAGDAAWSLAERAEAEGASAEATRWGRRAAALSPDDEGVLQRLIALLDRAGDRAGAIREYEAFAKRLREDYEAAPAPETTALIASVRAREQANGGVLPSAPVTQQAADAPVTSVAVEARRSWRTRRLAAGAIVALGAVAVAGATVIGNGRADAPALDPTRVLVDIFQNETGDPSLDHFGRMASEAWLRSDRIGALRTARRLTEIVPGSDYLKLGAQAALLLNHPREAIEFLTQADPASGGLSPGRFYWRSLTNAYHLLGDHEQELDVARRARQQYQVNLAARQDEIRTLAAMGRIDEVNAVIEERQVLEPKGAPADLMWTAAWELRAHGYRAAGMQMLQRRIEWLESRPAEVLLSVTLHRARLAISLMFTGRLDAARTMYEAMFEGRPDNDLAKLAFFAHLAAREGRPEEVLRISRLADSVPRPQEGPDKQGDRWWRTRIAVALGERERAVTLLREFVVRPRGGEIYPFLHTEFDLEPLWDYPPFQELIRPKG